MNAKQARQAGRNQMAAQQAQASFARFTARQAEQRFNAGVAALETGRRQRAQQA